MFIEYHAGYCLVKDIHTGKVVLKGELSNGLYKIGTTGATSSTSSCLRSDEGIMACSAVVSNGSINTVSKSLLH